MSELDNNVLEELDNMIVLTDENGEDVRFEFLDLMEHEGREYVVLMPEDQESEEGSEVVIMQVEAVGEDEETFVSVDDDALLDTLFGMFLKRFEENLEEE